MHFLLLKTKIVGIINLPLSHQYTVYQPTSVRLNSIAAAWDITPVKPWKEFNSVLKKKNRARF